MQRNCMRYKSELRTAGKVIFIFMKVGLFVANGNIIKQIQERNAPVFVYNSRKKNLYITNRFNVTMSRTIPYEPQNSKFSKKAPSSRERVLKQLSASNIISCEKRKRFKAFLDECRPQLVRDVFLDSGAEEVRYKSPWIVMWADGVVPMERFTRMKPYQKVNHFPGMVEICCKGRLATNLKRMKKLFPAEYDFFPLTFVLPSDAPELSRYCQKRKTKGYFIIKENNNCQGSGIQIVEKVSDEIRRKSVVCQRYIAAPLLMNGYKLDLRLYVLVTSVYPLRVYVFKEGLVRLATLPYEKPSASNAHEKRMHLTNYAINRSSSVEISDDGKGGSCKKSISDLDDLLDSLGLRRDHLWPSVDAMIVKTVLSALPYLRRLFRTSFPATPALSPCFEILGFDVLLDRNVKPYLLEVNRSPSLCCSNPMDRRLKTSLVKNTIEMVMPTRRQIALLDEEQRRKTISRLVNRDALVQLTAKERIVAEHQEKREAKNMGRFRQIYPSADGRFLPIVRSILGIDAGHRRPVPSLVPTLDRSVNDGKSSNESDRMECK